MEFQEFFNWFVQCWNDTTVFSDAYGASSQTKGQIFRETVYIFLGLSAVAGIALADIKGKLRSIPGKLKSIVRAGKAIKNADSLEDAQQELGQMGIKLPAAKQQQAQVPQMSEARLKKVKNVLMQLSEQVDKSSKKK